MVATVIVQYYECMMQAEEPSGDSSNASNQPNFVGEWDLFQLISTATEKRKCNLNISEISESVK